MVFNSLVFAAFFPCVLLLYSLVPTWSAKKWLLLFASYFFYASWDVHFAALLLLCTVVDWCLGKLLVGDGAVNRKRLLAVSLVFNVGVLVLFKYRVFLLHSLSSLLAPLGVFTAPASLSVPMVVGISFFTFQSMSFTIDVYRGVLRKVPSFRDYALFVSFFPQLVAGPIVRASDFIPQLERPSLVSSAQRAWGLCLLVIGVFQKQVLADGLFAPVVDEVYARLADASARDAWIGVFAFSNQIYFDFSGYSLCAIGAALCFGFALPDNFRQPYAALGPSDFWRRWHISLSTWLRDYLYIGLGGNRGGALRTGRNIMLTMMIGGLWHGASWMFFIWGTLHGVWLLVERGLRRLFRRASDAPANDLVSVACIGATFVLVSLTWIPFRAANMADARMMLSALARTGPYSVLTTAQAGACMTATAVTLALQFCWRRSSPEAIFRRLPLAIQAASLALILVMIYLLAGGSNRAFIYFQF